MKEKGEEYFQRTNNALILAMQTALMTEYEAGN
jgi:hypothetical protein